jgi:mono/diheme cytochrome c family protein
MDECARMKSIEILLVAGIGIGVAAFLYLQNGPTDAQVPMQPSSFDIAAGETLYAENCATCHGANLEGQSDWQSPHTDSRLPAPPHDATGHTWHHGDSLLFDYTKLGGQSAMAAQGLEFDSAMPGFGDTLTDDQIWNVIAYIKSTWPDQVHEMQQSRTESEQLRGN